MLDDRLSGRCVLHRGFWMVESLKKGNARILHVWSIVRGEMKREPTAIG